MFDGVPEHWNEESRPGNDDSHEPRAAHCFVSLHRSSCVRVDPHLLRYSCIFVALVTPDSMNAGNAALWKGLGLSVMALTLWWQHPVTARDPLSNGDYQWLARNLNVTSRSMVLQGLTVYEKIKVHTLIGAPNLSAEQRLQAVADYLCRINGDDLERMFHKF